LEEIVLGVHQLGLMYYDVRTDRGIIDIWAGVYRGGTLVRILVSL